MRKVVELLAFIGYEPAFSLKDSITGENTETVKAKTNKFKRKEITRIGVAGFCFANIMMLSFPEYLSSGTLEASLKKFFPLVNFMLSLPVLFYCAGTFFISAWKGLKQKLINIDAPIALAIVVTFGRSYYEILSGHGAGYLDSGTGIIFFMLVGRWFQNKTYDSLSFDRDYLSFLPLSITIVKDEIQNGFLQRIEKTAPVNTVKKGDHILVRNGEIIPVDAKLIEGKADIDYSFVNGENEPVQIVNGSIIYAGGKQVGSTILLAVEKEVSQSYITELWNNDIFTKKKHRSESYIHPWSRYFTFTLFAIAFGGTIFWAILNPLNIIPALVSVLIVACPCSLLLSATFTYGNLLRIFGRNKFYLKNAHIIEMLAGVDTIVFDKTGTLTQPTMSLVEYSGNPLSEIEKNMLTSLSNQTSHSLGKVLSSKLNGSLSKLIPVQNFKEYSGLGVEGLVNDKIVRLGTGGFIHSKNDEAIKNDGTRINVEIGSVYKGYFKISNHYREGIKLLVEKLNNEGYDLHVLSGDHNGEKENLVSIFGKEAAIKFRQLPEDKLDYIKTLQEDHKKVLMLGDGLNDAGALMQADVGIAINNNDSQFTPACDGILIADRIHDLSKYLRYAKSGKRIVTFSFILSIIYNLVGISFAVSASLSPIVAAILMPASSISIVLFVTVEGNISALRLKLSQPLNNKSLQG
ncbi:MAG: HAD-IC family P-type ATPase [Ferruginibacter sp.]